jgi:hypothetical protein
MFDPVQKIDSRWEIEKRWAKDGKQHSSVDVKIRPIKMSIGVKLCGLARMTILDFDGPTGFESYNLEDLVDLESDKDFCICGGTPNRWPACFVSMPEVRKFVQDYKASLET